MRTINLNISLHLNVGYYTYNLFEKDLIRWLFIWFKILIYLFLLGFDSIKLFKMYIKSKIYGWNVKQKTLWYMFMRVVETNIYIYIYKRCFQNLKKVFTQKENGAIFFCWEYRIGPKEDIQQS